jgi:hypothetical protein
MTPAGADLEPTAELDWIDRAARAADRLLVPRTAAILSGCILATHALLMTLSGAGFTMVSLHGFLTEPGWGMGWGETSIHRPAVSRLLVPLAAAPGFGAGWLTRLSGAGRLGPRILVLAVAPPWLYCTARPLWLAASIGAPGAAVTTVGFLAGLVVAVAWAERRW